MRVSYLSSCDQIPSCFCQIHGLSINLACLLRRLNGVGRVDGVNYDGPNPCFGAWLAAHDVLWKCTVSDLENLDHWFLVQRHSSGA